MTEPLDPFIAAMAAPGQPEPAFAALCALAERAVGVKLFTVMTFDTAAGLSRRRWSNMPRAYPPQGTKTTSRGIWSRTVLDERRPFVANDRAGIAEVFADHELIASLGCESCLNLPVVLDGAVLGALNMLHEAGWYTPERVSAARAALSVPGAVCLLLDRGQGQ